MSEPTEAVLQALLERRLTSESLGWLRASVEQIAAGVSSSRFATLISAASRFAPRRALAPSEEEIGRAARALPGWTPERWTTLEALRVRLIVSRRDLSDEAFVDDFEDCVRYADQGELCALYRSLPHLPHGERFVWRAGEGCRTNMLPVFEAVACDSPFPVRFFDDPAWRQLVIKAVFVGAPLWRVHGLDSRLSPELARMALDLADERRSAHRGVQPELWLCLGEFGGTRALASLEVELASPDPTARSAAALGLARANAVERLQRQLDEEVDDRVRTTIEGALGGQCDQTAFRSLSERDT